VSPFVSHILRRCKTLSWTVAGILSSGFAFGSGAPNQTDFARVEVRLLTPLSSETSAPGSEFQSVVIAPYERDGRVLLPSGTILLGSILRRKSVGLGVLHERASLSLEFREYELPDGSRFPIEARVEQIENAREHVTSLGRIVGVLAADSPQSVLGGVWTHPSFALAQRSFLGLTGVSGRIWVSYSLGPVGAIALFAAHCALFPMPNPEIQLPAGAEMRLVIGNLPEDAPEFAIAEPAVLAPGLAEGLSSQPYAVNKVGGRPVSDIVNVAFAGSYDDLVKAFGAAGWREPVVLNARSFSRVYGAFTAKKGYAEQPASRLEYEGTEPGLVFEKSLNTVLKRHHVRFWRREVDGQEVWLGAATHDIGMRFDRRGMRFTHRIQASIDIERSKIGNDLAFTGCVDAGAYVVRPSAARVIVNGNGISTDGRLLVLQASDCDVPAGTGVSEPFRPTGNLFTKTVRRMVLEGRQYVERANPIFLGYRAIQWRRDWRRRDYAEE
jgi:hypothetical protein